jgi:Ca2+-binding EF-hand superfamily protein
LRKHFDLKKVFASLDSDRDGFLRPEDFCLLFENAGILLAKRDLFILLTRFDQNRDGLVSYSEFIAELNPKSP